MYEDLGFDMVWSVEHHFTDYELIPDPVQMLSYVCGRTKKIGLGTFVIVLPWHDPVRVAEQIAMLDNFARGRELLLGFGRGAAQVEYDGFRVSMSEARERLIEEYRGREVRPRTGSFFLCRRIFQHPGDAHSPASGQFGPDRTDVRGHYQPRDWRDHGAGRLGHADHPPEELGRPPEGL